MQSKNSKAATEIDAPIYIPGVITTALVLFLIQFKILVSYYSRWWSYWFYPVLLFLAVVFIYSADHAWDAWSNRKMSHRYSDYTFVNLIMLCLSGVLGLLTLYANINDVHWRTLVYPGGLFLIYYLLYFLKIKFAGLKELLIALAVSCALFYPVIGDMGFSDYSWSFLTVFFVCLQNLFLFGYFEKTKDDLFGNFTIFQVVTSVNSRIMLTIALIFITIPIIALEFATGQKFPMAWTISLVYLIMGLNKRWFYVFGIYRILADVALLLLLF